MKKFIFPLLLISAALTWISCDSKQGTDPEPEPEQSQYYEFPLEWQEDAYVAEDNGVNINVSAVDEDNIVFTLVPGAAVKSYRMTLYSKAIIYNLLLNEGHVEGTREECEQTLIELLSTTTVFNEAAYDDFEAKEFDWINSAYASAPIIPDCEYFIIVEACYDTEGQNPASVCIAHLTTPSKEIVGNPEIGIEAEVGYSAFIVRYHPNEDCKYFYHWIWVTEEIGGFIDLFGDKLMRDFCRSVVSGPYDATLEENLAIKRTFDTTGTIRENTAVAVACDANGTPTDVLMRNDFVLLDVPEGDFVPVARIEAGSRVGATVANFDVEMEKNCMSCFYRLYTAEDAEILKNASDAEKATICHNLASEGWGVSNRNFSFNPELGTLTGDAFRSSSEIQMELIPDTEYVVVYVAKNYFQDLSDLCFSETFRTKPLVRDNPEACEADIDLYFTEISRWGFTYNFEYDYENTAAFRFQVVWPYEENSEILPPHYINDADDREKWMEFFYDTFVMSPAGFAMPITNIWTTEKSGYDGYAMYGYESGVTYVIAYCAEDFNGVVGPVKFVEVTTTETNPGPNPAVEIDGIEYSDDEGAINGRFKSNEDAKMIKYLGVTSADASLFSSCALNDLVNGKRRDYDAYMTLWKTQLIELGLSSNAESVSFSVNCEKNSDSPVLVAAVSIGETEEGLDCYSDIVCKIYYKGEFKDLSDFRTPPTE